MKLETKVTVFAMLLLVACLQTQAQSSGTIAEKAKLTVAQKEVQKQQKEREKKLELINYYGLSDSRFEEYQRIQKRKEDKIKALIELNLPREVRISKAAVIANENRAQLKNFFTPSQYTLFELRVKKLKEVKARQNTCIKAYKEERRNLSSLAKPEKRKAIRNLNAKYIQRMSLFLSPEKAEKAILDIDYFNLANNKFIKKQKLPKKQVVALGRVMEERDLRLEKVKAQSLSYAEKKKRIQTIKEWEKKRLAKILGPKRYADYANYQNHSHERRCKTQYGFTDADYSAYKRIENNFAIKVMAIKKSSAMQAEKKQKIALAKESKIAALREALPASTFEKWYEGNQKRTAESTKKNLKQE